MYICHSAHYPLGDSLVNPQVCSANRCWFNRYTQGFLWTAANDPALQGLLGGGSGLCADEFNETDHFPPALYVRAARRLVGPKVFTQNTPRDQANGLGNMSIGVGCCEYA
jgi:hypothetical protein